MKQTNTVVKEATTIKFAALLDEGLRYVDMWTPTDINSGGCGIFADLLTDEFISKNIPYKIYGLFSKDNKQEQSFEENLKKYLKGEKYIKKKLGIEHVVVQIEDALYVDSMGIENAKILSHYDLVELTKEDLLVLNNMKNMWNQVFDRDCTPIIKEKITEVFSHIKDFKSGMFKYPQRREVHYTKKTLKERSKDEKFNFLNLLR